MAVKAKEATARSDEEARHNSAVKAIKSMKYEQEEFEEVLDEEMRRHDRIINIINSVADQEDRITEYVLISEANIHRRAVDAFRAQERPTQEQLTAMRIELDQEAVLRAEEIRKATSPGLYKIPEPGGPIPAFGSRKEEKVLAGLETPKSKGNHYKVILNEKFRLEDNIAEYAEIMETKYGKTREGYAEKAPPGPERELGYLLGARLRRFMELWNKSGIKELAVKEF
jgi:hypothetical protein